MTKFDSMCDLAGAEADLSVIKRQSQEQCGRTVTAAWNQARAMVLALEAEAVVGDLYVGRAGYGRAWRIQLVKSEAETLTEALKSVGVSHEGGALSGQRKLSLGHETVSLPVCASSGWELVRLLRSGFSGSFKEAVDTAVETAATKAWC